MSAKFPGKLAVPDRVTILSLVVSTPQPRGGPKLFAGPRATSQLQPVAKISSNYEISGLSITVTNPNQIFSYQLGALSVGQFALTVAENGRGHVEASPYANRHAAGQIVTLSAVSDVAQDFIGWTGDANGSDNPLTVLMDASKTITANFAKRPTLRAGTPLEGLVEDGFRLTVLGEFGSPCSILASTNLFDWIAVGTVTNTYGIVQFTDPGATNLPHSFYRTVSDE